MIKLRFLGLLAIGCAIAGSNDLGDTRSSSHYGITTEAIAINGGRAASASGRYAVNASLSEPAGGIAEGAAFPLQLVKQGFIGQLYDLTRLTISSGTPTIDEGATRQLAADAVLDDDSTLKLATANVIWNVNSGPIISVDADGLIQTDVVYQDETAGVSGTFQGVGGVGDLNVINIDNDNFRTYAADGLPDEWQVEFFAIDNVNAGSALDPDKDGVVNFLEYAFNSNPTVGGSGLTNLPVQTLSSDGVPNDSFLTLTFKRRTAPAPVNYRVEVSGKITGPWVETTQMVGSPGTPDENGLVTVTFRDTVTVSQAGKRFIRLLVSSP